LILWNTCRRDFKPDGALRDIYVLRTGVADWNQLLATLSNRFRFEYFVDGLTRLLPADAEQIFAIQKSAKPLLRVQVGAITAACHFFTIDEIEFDIDPREIISQESLDELLGFVRLIGDCVTKQVTITYENDQQHPFISYDPKDNGMSYHE